MGEMVERVARAIYETDPVGVRPWEDAPTSNREDCIVCARAAIAAMREPTVKMYRASEFPNAGCIGDQWRAMIDAALNE